MCRGGGSERMAKKNMENREMKKEKRKKLKRHVAQEAQLEPETELKKKKQNLEASGPSERDYLLTSCSWDICIASLTGICQATNEEKDLTAEERRKLERKLKKERKKKEKKLMREAGISTKKEEPKKLSGSELALAYLTSWSEKPEEWKFQKTRQTWLLLHMYDKEKVPDEYFTILLDYLQGLKGSARDVTVQKAEALMKEFDNSDAEDASLVEKCERIRQVLQLLS
uniref:Chromosome 7 open reading frame 50 n=1 Tax=Apteryx owenii TaxID=8824 RepID=A0A8B9QL16_APTOW